MVKNKEISLMAICGGINIQVEGSNLALIAGYRKSLKQPTFNYIYMIQAVESDNDGNIIIGCCVHDMVLDFILSMS
jgi:hypothetical protein